MDVLGSLLSAEPTPLACEDLDAFWARHELEAECAPIEAALRGGFAADRLAWAFLAGYQAALRALLGDARPAGLTSLCATEAGGAHPRAIEARISPEGDALRLEGHKRWSTLATRARSLLVLASRGVDAAGRKRLVLVRVRADAPGVRIEKMPDAPFAPEIPHAEVRFDGVRVAEQDVLAGDGWEGYVKPFRTIEDVHVHAALLGHALSLARRGGAGHETIARLAALVVAVSAIAARDPRAPSTHVALAGAIERTRAALVALEPAIVALGEPVAGRWARDRALLDVAGKARALRLEAAFAALGEGR